MKNLSDWADKLNNIFHLLVRRPANRSVFHQMPIFVASGHIILMKKVILPFRFLQTLIFLTWLSFLISGLFLMGLEKPLYINT